MVSTKNPSAHLEAEEDDEATTDEDQRQRENRASASKQKAAEEPMEQDEEEQEDEEGEEDESSEEEQLPRETLVSGRARRANAGRKMAELIQQQVTAEREKDDFYGTAYGGFQEDEQDDEFESPPHSSDDEVDSDFDKPEEEDEGGAAPAEEDPERIERRKKKMKQKQLYERNKNWAIARINKAAVPENVCDAKTQKQRLAEAKKTAELNIASLKRFEEFELERKRRQAKPGQRPTLQGPRTKELWTPDGKHFITMPELPPKEKIFPRAERREYRVCAITGRPARYIDPITRLPYVDVAAFRAIRDKYKQFLESEAEAKRSTMANRSDASAGFGRQETSAKQRKLIRVEDL